MREHKEVEENKNNIVRIRLELKDDYLSDDQKRMLKRYGESSTGDSIVRDILMPIDMPLHNLHYAIQKLFGWQNSHLRSFHLPEEKYEALTEGTVKGWSDLVGVLFQPPSEAEEDLFWDEDYEKGSINTWLKKKYTGPYRYGGTIEHEAVAKQDIKVLLDHFDMIEVRESFRDFMARSKQDGSKETKVIKTAPLIELTLEEMNASVALEGGTESLLERLEVNQVIASQSETLATDELIPITQELIYKYDFGDNWNVHMTKYNDCSDLLEQNLVSEAELVEAQATVLCKHQPVCIHKDGLSVLDDVGGLSGFADLLGVIYEGEDKEEKASLSAWAKSMGWHVRKSHPQKML